MPLRPIKSRTLAEVQAELRDWNEPAYRATQVFEWLYARRATDWSDMTNVPRRLRERLAQLYAFTPLTLAARQDSADATRKFLWQLPDRALIESVLIPANPAFDTESADRQTLCVSTQVGCAYGCKFCASGLHGWKRNLGADEIVEQVLATERWGGSPAASDEPGVPPTFLSASLTVSETETVAGWKAGGTGSWPPGQFRKDQATSQEMPPGVARAGTPARWIDNLVLMGMGEPLANYDNVLQALRILNAPWGIGIGARKITVSTSGLCPEIRRLAEEPHQFRLAISLHGATDTVRNRLMPINRKYPLRELIAACEAYQTAKGRLITFEYILIKGVNDDLAQVRPLADLARRLHAKVNLIPCNRVEGLPWERPAPASQEAFLNALEARGVTATLRRERGDDIDAACGQLRLRTER